MPDVLVTLKLLRGPLIWAFPTKILEAQAPPFPPKYWGPRFLQPPGSTPMISSLMRKFCSSGPFELCRLTKYTKQTQNHQALSDIPSRNSVFCHNIHVISIKFIESIKFKGS